MLNSLTQPLLRLAPIAIATAVLGTGVAAIDLALGKLFHDPERWEHDIIYWDRVAEIGERLAAYQQLQITPEKTVALLGSSSVWCDFDAKQLAANDPKNRAWLPLGAAGSRVHSISEHTHALLALDPLPAQIVIGVHQIHFSAHPHERLFEPLPFAGDSPKARLLSVLSDRSFAYNYRRAAPPLHKDLIYRTRLAFSPPLSLLHPPATDPFEFPSAMAARPPVAKTPYPEKPRYQDFLATCNPANFNDLPNNPEVASLIHLITHLTARGSTVTIVLMPEKSSFRSLFAESRDQFITSLRSLLPPGTLLLDLTTSMPDSLFYDPIHLNRDGAAQFSEQFPDLLEKPSPDVSLTPVDNRAPPMLVTAP